MGRLASGSFSAWTERVPEADPIGDDVCVVAEFAPQARDVDVYGSLHHRLIVCPDGTEDIVPSQGMSFVPDEEHQDVVLGTGQREGCAAYGDRLGLSLDGEGPGLEDLGGGIDGERGSGYDALHSRRELLRGEGFFDVVVRTGSEAAEHIALGRLCGQEDDGDHVALCPETGR